MSKVPIPAGESALAREASTFPAFPNLTPNVRENFSEWFEALQLQPVSAIEWQCNPDWALGPRTVVDSMYFWFMEGHGWGEVQGLGRRFTIEPGSMMLIPEGALHTVRQTPGKDMKVIAVHFHATLFGSVNFLELGGFPAYLPPQPANATLGKYSEELAREYAVKAAGWRTAMQTKILEVLLCAMRFHHEQFSKPALDSSARRASWARLVPILSWIDQNLEDPELNVPDLARQMHISEVQFRKVFRTSLGLSPARFIQRRRVQRACDFLRNSSLSIEQISRECGFREIGFFARIFKTWMGIPPGKFRNQPPDIFV